MNCLCCGKPLKTDDGSGWHKSCIKRFFGTSVLPEIEIDKETLESIVTEGVGKGLTVPGVQKKLSLHLFSDGKTPRLTLVNFPTGYILKPQTEEFTALPESEQLVMHMADVCGISTVPHALIAEGGSYAYITKRVDRVIEKSAVSMLAMEDFCQLDLRLTADKYKGSYERCAKIIERYSSRKAFDLAEFFARLVFCFLTGNSDMHLKNFSLIETAENSGEYILSPAYDLLPVNVIMPEDREQFALTMNGKKTNLRRGDFLKFADACGISRAAAEKMIARLLAKEQILLDLCDASLLPDEMKLVFRELVTDRSKTLCGE
ncbi:MAG: HipA domain-containing protein [Clostridia bacterium]|nr:HipA domain-containing protein [Clostridia bacterium]